MGDQIPNSIILSAIMCGRCYEVSRIIYVTTQEKISIYSTTTITRYGKYSPYQRSSAYDMYIATSAKFLWKYPWSEFCTWLIIVSSARGRGHRGNDKFPLSFSYYILLLYDTTMIWYSIWYVYNISYQIPSWWLPQLAFINTYLPDLIPSKLRFFQRPSLFW